MSDKLFINKVDNGYILKDMDEEEPSTEVFEIKDFREFSELTAVQYLLYTLIDKFGVSGSKYDKVRLRIVFHNDNDEEVEIDSNGNVKVINNEIE